MSGNDAIYHTNVTLGAQVRAARIDRGISLRTLARSLSVSPATLSQIEHGRTALTAVRLKQIADILKMATTDILEAPRRDRGPTSKWKPAPSHQHSDAESEYPSTCVQPDPSQITSSATRWRVYNSLEFGPALCAALDEMLQVGYHGTSLRKIAARSGFSVAGLYHHYATKQDMLALIITQAMNELLWRARSAQREGNDPAQRFSLLIENLALFHMYRKDISFIAATEMRSLEASLRNVIEIYRTTHNHIIMDEADAAVNLGHFRTDQPYAATRAAIALCTDIAGWWQSGTELAPEQLAKQYVDFALALVTVRSQAQVGE